MLRRGTALAAGLIVGYLLVAAAPAAASVTIGSDLAPDPGASTGCSTSNPCTLANLALPSGQVSSPIDGVVTSWAVRQAGTGSPARLRVLRPIGMGSFEAINSSTTQMLPASSPVVTKIFPAQQPIKAGDIVGLDVDTPNSLAIATAPQMGATAGRWQPPLADGANLSPVTQQNNSEFLFNATIEPDCDGDGLGDQTQDPDISSCNPKPKDTTPPNTTIGKGPKKVIHAKGPKTKVKFTFSSTEVGSTFKCKLDKKAFAACTSPKTYKVKPGKHSFQVEAVDAAGNIDATPAKQKFKVLPAVQ
jgi:hypothetical protein